jgi:hypothetical protein
MHSTITITNRILRVTLALGFTLPMAAQPAWQWAIRGDASGTFDAVYGRGIATDAQGNVYVAGKFSGTATFGDTNSPVASFGDSDAFLAKYSTLGQLQWVRKFGGAGYDEANAVAVGTNGHVYVVGRYSGPGTFGGFTLTNANFATGFTLEFDPGATNVLWAKDDGLAWFGVAADGNGNVSVVGQPAGFSLVGSKLVGPIALAKYNASGVRQWYTNSLAPNLSTSGAGQAIALDAAGNVHIAGVFRRVVEFGATSLTNAAVANNVYDEIFVAKFSSAGVPLWARRGGGEGNDQGLGIGVDGGGNVIVTGYCDNTTALNSGTSVQFDLGGFVFPGAVGGGLGNMFLAKFSPSGTGLWARKLGSPSYGAAVAVTPSGEFYATGNFRTASMDFGGVILDKPFTQEELFVVKYDAAGNAMWGRRTSSTLPGTRFGRAVAAMPDGSVYATGEYLSVSPIVFDNTTLGSKSGGTSMFVAKLAASDAAGPTVQSVRLLGGGAIELAVSGTASQSFVIQASGTPGDFISISTNTMVGGVLQFTDPGGSGAPARFYRLKVP